MKMYISTILILMLLSCNNNISIKNFDSKKWKSDSINCFCNRENMVSIIMVDKSSIIGKKSEKVIQVLGKPDFVFQDRFYYKAGCLKDKFGNCLNKNDTLYLESPELVIEFKDNIVSDISNLYH